MQIQQENVRFTTIVQKRLRIIMSKHSALKRQVTNFKSNKRGFIMNRNVFKETSILLSAGPNTESGHM